MSIDDQKVQQVVDKVDREGASSQAFIAEVNMKRVGGPDPSLSLEELERNADIARARACYASEQLEYWKHEHYNRSMEMSKAIVAVYYKKHNLTDADMERPWNQSHMGVFEYAK